MLVGAGERARAWLAPLRRSRRLRAVGTVARGEAVGADLSPYFSLEEAMRVLPGAAFAVALPPRAGLESALLLAEAGRAAIVEAPLHDALIDAALGAGAAAVRVAHGWVTLPGLGAVASLVRRAGGGRLTVEVAGVPEEDRGDLYEGLVHAAALVRALLPEAAPVAARQVDAGGLEVDFAAPSPGSGWTLSLRLLTRGRRVKVHMAGMSEEVRWSWENDRESLVLGRTPLVEPRATPPAASRALAQLLPHAPRGDGLFEAAAVLRLSRSCLSLLPTRLAIGERSLRQSASIARRRPSDLLARLGLRGELPTACVEPAPAVLALVPPPEPFELWSFRAGLQPAVFLTVPPQEVERTLSYFGAVHCERRERRVRIEAQDRWRDRRQEGEPRVELYIARDAELARRAARLQAAGDPTRALRELGVLFGYPPCCVDAFALLDDRANNTRNRYHTQARTLAPDGSTEAPWPWELNNLHTVVIPFYPCSYRCERALAWARASLAEMARAHPALAQELRTALARPVLYFDHEHQLVLDGEPADGIVEYRGVSLPRAAPPHLTPLAAAVGRGDRLSLDDRRLLVERGGQAVLRLERTDPALGFVAPFGSGARRASGCGRGGGG